MSEAMITRRGGGGGRLQAKTVTPAAIASTVTPDSGYDGLSSVMVAAITPQKEATSYTPGTADQTIAANQWLAGAQIIQGDTNLLAANIKKGISIFNVAGSYEAAALDTNSAILKVVTSTGCSVSVTNGTDTFTQQDADGFVRTGDANVTEHFFVIPTAAFGDFDVTATHPTYGPNTKTRAATIGNAGKVYEVLCGGKNIILDGTFGLQDGIQLYESWITYDATERQINIASQNGSWLFGNSVTGGAVIPVAAYTKITIRSTSGNYGSGYLYLLDQDRRTLATIGTTSSWLTQTVDITNKYYDTAGIYFSSVKAITEIILT